MIGLGTAMLVSGLASAIAGLGTGVSSAVSQYNAQKEAKPLTSIAVPKPIIKSPH